jgi:very-short-patch-repair endonuclease
MSERVFNLKNHQYLRVKLRSNMPEPERRLWRHIRGRQLGVKFRRQHGIGIFIVDFYCSEKHLVIELDGASHFTEDAQLHDRERSEYLQDVGLEVVRFTNEQIMNELDSVLQVLFHKVQ